MTDKMTKKVMKNVLGGYDYGDRMSRIISDYIKEKMTYKEEPDMAITKELMAEELDLARRFIIRENREKVLYILLIKESDWLRHHPEYDKTDQSQLRVIINVVNDHKKILDKNWKLEYRIYKTLEKQPIPKGCDTEKALRWHIKQMKIRLTGKTSPVDIMVNNDIRLTPFLGYSMYLIRQNKSIWEYVKELFPNFRVLNDDSFANEKTEIDHEEFIKKFDPVLEYVYGNNKLNFLNFRNEIWDKKEREEKKKNDMEKVRMEKTKKIISMHLGKAIYNHNKWYYAGRDELSRSQFPRKFDKFVNERDELGHEFIILAVTKRPTGGYKSGYLNKDFIGYSLESPYTYKTMDEAKDAINKFKADGIILEGTAVPI